MSSEVHKKALKASEPDLKMDIIKNPNTPFRPYNFISGTILFISDTIMLDIVQILSLYAGWSGCILLIN